LTSRYFSELPRRQETTVLVLCAAIYSVYLPLAWWGSRNYVPPEKPVGKVVELITKFELTHGDVLLAQVYANAPYADADLYENAVLLRRVDVQQRPSRPQSWRFIITPQLRDGSDPRTNGRNYYLVQN
jgi:hypothetical protein